MKTKITDALQVTAALLITGSMAFAMTPPKVTEPEHTTSSVVAQLEETPDVVVEEEKQEEKPVEKPVEKPKPVTWRDNPNKCDQEKQWIAKEAPFKCIDKPITVAAAPTQSKPASAPAPSVGSGSCAAEIRKYDWNHSVATAVMLAESGGDPGIVNNNPATKDYSVGCFQVNLYGANARYRPSEAALKNAATNVQWAYNNYVANGHSFIGQWGVCRTKVSCY